MVAGGDGVVTDECVGTSNVVYLGVIVVNSRRPDGIQAKASLAHCAPLRWMYPLSGQPSPT